MKWILTYRFILLQAMAVLYTTCYPLALLASDQIPAPPQDHPIALVGGTIHPVSGPVLERGTILFDQGKITVISSGEITLPPNTERIDITGKHVYPGMIAGHTQLGLMEIGSIRATRDFTELGEITPNVRPQAAVNPDSELLPVTRANGVLLALTVPSGELVSGTSAMIMMDGWTWEDMTFQAPIAMHIQWPVLNMNSRFGPDTRTPDVRRKERDKRITALKTAFREARAYHKARVAATQRGVPYHDSDLRWEAMIPVITGKIPVIVHTDELQDIQNAVAWAEETGVRMILSGGRDAWRSADLLKEKEIPVMIGAVHLTPTRRWEDYDTPFTQASKLYQAGITYCIAGGQGESPAVSTYNVRNLPYQAATAAAYGLPAEEALKSVTLYPAQILGVADRVGSLEVHKDATLIVTDGDPLEITTNVEQAFIQGRNIDLSSKHTQLYEKYKIKYKRLEQ